MGAIRERAITIVRGEGATVWDDEGNALLDASASLWFCNVGHGRRELADAAAAQMRQLATFQTYERYTSPPTEALAARVAGLVPLEGAKVYFTSGGGEAIDTAAKLSRAYWAAVGRPDKRVLDPGAGRDVRPPRPGRRACP
jgi:putrescine---pyruvate transaminase